MTNLSIILLILFLQSTLGSDTTKEIERREVCKGVYSYFQGGVLLNNLTRKRLRFKKKISEECKQGSSERLVFSLKKHEARPIYAREDFDFMDVEMHDNEIFYMIFDNKTLY